MTPLDGLKEARRRPWSYLKIEPAPDAPISDNPSGLYCKACRRAGLHHCSEPEWCGGMEPMRPAIALAEAEAGQGGGK